VPYRGKRFSTTPQVPFVVKIKELHFRWRYWSKIGLVALGILVVALAIFLIVRKILKKIKKKKELAELKAQGKAPPVAGQVFKMAAPPGVKAPAEAKGLATGAKGLAKGAEGGAKMAAGGGAKAAAGGAKAAAGGAKAAAGGGAKAAAGIPGMKAAAGGGDAKAAAGPKVCPTCGRTMLPGWTKCMFCAAGIGKAKG
jgi:hypothetical protein